jgi:quercetin dioxygenase-like cupin family protein
MLLQGRVKFVIGDEEKTLQPGDVWCIPGNVRHKVIVLEGPARAIDVFTPLREEYL